MAKNSSQKKLQEARKRIETSRQEIDASRARQGLEPKKGKAQKTEIPQVELTPDDEKLLRRKLIGWGLLVVAIILDLVFVFLAPDTLALQIGTDNPTTAPKLLYLVVFTLAMAVFAWMDERDDLSAKWIPLEAILLLGHVSVLIFNTVVK